MSNLPVGFKNPPINLQTNTSKEALKEDVKKKRKQPDSPKDSRDSEFMGAMWKFARINMPIAKQYKKVEEPLQIDSTWMVKLPERLTHPFQYTTESTKEENQKEL